MSDKQVGRMLAILCGISTVVFASSGYFFFAGVGVLLLAVNVIASEVLD